MTFLPIVERELRVAARRRGTYWSRTLVALVVVGIGMWIYLMGRNASPAEVSSGMFIGLTIVTGLFCLFAGVQTTSDCLSEEKRDGTLGLLFLTDLRGYDVVAGKLVAGSLNVFYGLLATLPMLAIPLLMGGVTGGEFWRVTLVLVNTLFFSLACGMFGSVLSRSTRSGVMLCLLLVILFSGLLPLTAVIIAASTNFVPDPLDLAVLFIPSPGYDFALAFDQNYKSAQGGFWLSLVVIHCIAWAFLGITCFLLPRSWQDKAATATQLRWRDRWSRWSLGDSADRARYRTQLLDVNAFYWLAARSRIKPAMVWALLGAIACCWIWGWMKIGRDWLNPGIYLTTALLLNTLLKCWFSAESVAQVAEDRRIGSLELLLSTPLDVFDITRGQLLALLRQFARPILLVLAVELAFMTSTFVSNAARGDEGTWFLLWLGGLAVFVADLWTLFHVGMWYALTSRNGNRAYTAALARILALPWILFGLFLILISLAAVASPGGPNISEEFVIVVWIILSLAVDLFFGLRAKSSLETRFREAATARYAPTRSLWSRVFGGLKSSGQEH